MIVCSIPKKKMQDQTFFKIFANLFIVEYTKTYATHKEVFNDSTRESGEFFCGHLHSLLNLQHHS